MKSSRRALLLVAFLFSVMMVGGAYNVASALPTTDTNFWNFLATFYGGVTVGPRTAPGQSITASYFFCDQASDSLLLNGTWSSRSTSTSTAESFNMSASNPGGVANVPKIGSTCIPVLGALVAAQKQALNYQCEVSSNGTATLHVTNASGGSLTPTTGQRCVRTFTP